MPLLAPKIDILYKYSDGDRYSTVRDLFGFGCPFGSPIEDNLKCLFERYIFNALIFLYIKFARHRDITYVYNSKLNILLKKQSIL